MDEYKLKDLIEQAQQGDQSSRETIISHFKSFVLNVASRVTKRYLTWSDDETSVGLTALNKAIDHFNHTFGKNFINYSYLVISREIIDFFRREKRHQHLSLSEPSVIGDEQDLLEESHYERIESEKQFSLKTEQSELIQEILIYQTELTQYGLAFDELPELSPKHVDTRENCFKLASVMIENSELVVHMRKKKRLPIADLSRASGIPAKTIEKNRKYILAVTICLLHPELERLQAYIKKGGDGDAGQ